MCTYNWVREFHEGEEGYDPLSPELKFLLAQAKRGLLTCKHLFVLASEGLVSEAEFVVGDLCPQCDRSLPLEAHTLPCGCTAWDLHGDPVMDGGSKIDEAPGGCPVHGPKWSEVKGEWVKFPYTG